MPNNASWQEPYSLTPAAEVPTATDKDLWLIFGILPKGITLFSAESTAGKSWVASDVGLHLAEGTPFGGVIPSLAPFGLEDVPPVLYFGERSSAVMAYRRSLLARHYFGKGPLHSGREVSNFFIARSCAAMRLDSEESQDNLAEVISASRPSLVIIDTLRPFMSGKENSSDDTAAVFSFLTEMREEFDTSFLVIHHLGKVVEHGPSHRGSGVLRAAPDASLYGFQDEREGKVPGTHVALHVSSECNNTAEPVPWTWVLRGEERRPSLVMDDDDRAAMEAARDKAGLGPLLGG